jgi:hypothetical protein
MPGKVNQIALPEAYATYLKVQQVFDKKAVVNMYQGRFTLITTAPLQGKIPKGLQVLCPSPNRQRLRAQRFHRPNMSTHIVCSRCTGESQ